MFGRDFRDRERDRERDRDPRERDPREQRDRERERERGRGGPSARNGGGGRFEQERRGGERSGGGPTGRGGGPGGLRASNGGTMVAAPVKKPAIVVDREKTCPFLVRVFTSLNGHHRPEDFDGILKNPALLQAEELHIHTWRDATLREISSLIKSVRPEARPRDVKISFSSVYPDKRSGRFLIRELGKVHSSAKGIDDQKTLDEVRFEIGDFLDVSISK